LVSAGLEDDDVPSERGREIYLRQLGASALRAELPRPVELEARWHIDYVAGRFVASAKDPIDDVISPDGEVQRLAGRSVSPDWMIRFSFISDVTIWPGRIAQIEHNALD